MAKKVTKKPAAKAAAPAMPKPAKLVQSGKPRSKGELFRVIGEHTGVHRKHVAAVFETMAKVMAVDLAKPGKEKPNVFVVPGLMKVQAVYKPPQAAKPGKNPFTGEAITIKAKPASTKIRIRPLKQLKAMV
jgi:nucleoid DNA-binding protein